MEHITHVPGATLDEFLEELHYMFTSTTLPLSLNIVEDIYQNHSVTTEKSEIKEIAKALSISNPYLK